MIFLIMIFAAACGYEDKKVRVEYDTNEVPYTFAEIKTVCGKCHNSTAPQIPLDEAAFKASAKIKAEISSGDMPPTKGDFDKARALKFLE